MYPKNPEYLATWNGKIALPQGWARRGDQSDSNIARDSGLTQNPDLRTKVSREVSSTVRSSQSASDSVDRLIDAINDGKIPINDTRAHPFATTDNSLCRRREVHPYCSSSRFQGSKSRVGKIIDEFLDVARKRGLYNPSSPRNRYLGGTQTNGESMVPKSWNWKTVNVVRPTRQSGGYNHFGCLRKGQQQRFPPRLGKLDFSEIDNFSRSSSPDLFDVDQHAESVASTPDSVFCNQANDDWCSTSLELNYFTSQPPTWRSSVHSEPESHYPNSCFWFPSQPDLQSSLKSRTHRNPQSHKADSMSPFLTRSKNLCNANDSMSGSHKPAVFSRGWKSNQKTSLFEPARRTCPQSSTYWGFKGRQSESKSQQPDMSSQDLRRCESCNQAVISHQISPMHSRNSSPDEVGRSEQFCKPMAHCVCCRFYGSRATYLPDWSIHTSTKRPRGNTPKSNTLERNISRNYVKPRDNDLKQRPVADDFSCEDGRHVTEGVNSPSFIKQLGNLSNTLQKYSKSEFQAKAKFEFISPIERPSAEQIFNSTIQEPLSTSHRSKTERIVDDKCSEFVARQFSQNGSGLTNPCSHVISCQSGYTKKECLPYPVPCNMRHQDRSNRGITSCDSLEVFTPIECSAVRKFASPPEPRGLAQSVNSKTAIPDTANHYSMFKALATSTPYATCRSSEKDQTSTSPNEATSTKSTEGRTEKIEYQAGYLKTPDWADRLNLSRSPSKLILGGAKSVTIPKLSSYIIEE